METSRGSHTEGDKHDQDKGAQSDIRRGGRRQWERYIPEERSRAETALDVAAYALGLTDQEKQQWENDTREKREKRIAQRARQQRGPQGEPPPAVIEKKGPISKIDTFYNEHDMFDPSMAASTSQQHSNTYKSGYNEGSKIREENIEEAEHGDEDQYDEGMFKGVYEEEEDDMGSEDDKQRPTKRIRTV